MQHSPTGSERLGTVTSLSRRPPSTSAASIARPVAKLECTRAPRRRSSRPDRHRNALLVLAERAREGNRHARELACGGPRWAVPLSSVAALSIESGYSRIERCDRRGCGTTSGSLNSAVHLMDWSCSCSRAHAFASFGAARHDSCEYVYGVAAEHGLQRVPKGGSGSGQHGLCSGPSST